MGKKKLQGILDKIHSLLKFLTLSNIAIIITLISFIATEKQRRNAAIFQAWQVITAAHKQPGSGGRKEALEFLNSEPIRVPRFWLKWKRQSLVNLSAPEAYLYQINLQEALLGNANLREADLGNANLQEADLGNANLQGAILNKANLQGAIFNEANLQEAYLGSSILQEAYLFNSDLRDANLFRANLQDADLLRANLQDADLRIANLQDTNLQSANLQNANLLRANFQGANLKGANIKDANLFSANLQNAVLGEVTNSNLEYIENIKSACFWDKAVFKSQWDSEKEIFVAIEPANSMLIEKLQQDKSSNPEILPDCAYWDEKLTNKKTQ